MVVFHRFGKWVFHGWRRLAGGEIRADREDTAMRRNHTVAHSPRIVEHTTHVHTVRHTATVPSDTVREVAEKLIREHQPALDWLADR